MTSYTTIPDSSVDQDSAITQPLMTALRDNPVAIAENDASVPLNLRSTVLLGTLTTTSGATQTLSGLDLSYYSRVRLVFNAVSYAGTGTFISVGTTAVRTVSPASAADTIFGMCEIDLATGIAVIQTSSASGLGTVYSGLSTYTNASTSIVVTMNGGGTFDAGSIRVYGHK